MSRDVRGLLIYHHWCLERDLELSVINFFSNKNMFSRTSGNGLISILALSDHRKDPSGTHLCPFSYFFIFFYLISIIGRPFRHNRLSWGHNFDQIIYGWLSYSIYIWLAAFLRGSMDRQEANNKFWANENDVTTAYYA